MRFLLLLLALAFAGNTLYAQLIINEASCRNFTQIADSKGGYHDWIEIFNAGSEEVNLYKYYLSDDVSDLKKWTFPFLRLPARQYLIVFASGETMQAAKADHWETAVREEHSWRWINPTAATPADWMRSGFSVLVC